VKRKKKRLKIVKRKFKDKWTFRILFYNKELFGYNSHKLPRAVKRGDRRNIKHIHLPYPLTKFHIPLDLKYVKYVLSDAWKRIKRKFR